MSKNIKTKFLDNNILITTNVNDPNCTFKPKTNKINNSYKCANKYLKQNAFERLSKPQTIEIIPMINNCVNNEYNNIKPN